MSEVFSPGISLDRYIVERELGAGAAGVVMRVRHETLGTLHAIKVLRIHEESLAQRMLQEAQMQGQLRHPNIVAVSDFLDIDGRPAIVQEYVEGPSLAALLNGPPLALERIEELATGLLNGIAAAHEVGIVHRDLKPANILVDQSGSSWVPKITDFGLVKCLTSRSENRTRSGSALGTPGYMAPEQMADASTVDTRADVFSMGVVLYEMVTGVRPFQAETLKGLYEQASAGAYRDVGEVRQGIPETVKITIAKALEPNPNERPRNGAELLHYWSQGSARTPSDHLTWQEGRGESGMGWEIESDAPRPTDSGQRIGRYSIEEVLGEGGWGCVYRARMDGPVGFRKAVALKVLHRANNDAQASQDLINEARLGGLLKHPNIIEIYDLGIHEDEFYIAMEWVRGGNIREKFEAFGAFSTRAIVELGQQVCAGLDHAHNLLIEGQPAGLVHRDLKPSNLLVDPNGLIKIADFGIATTHEIVDQSGESQLIRGTPAYMAPEQRWGDSSAIGPHTDLFALGTLLSELLMGERVTPRQAGVPLRASLLDFSCNEDLKEILLRCIHLEPEERCGSAMELAAALSQVAVEGPSLLEVLGLSASMPGVGEGVAARLTAVPFSLSNPGKGHVETGERPPEGGMPASVTHHRTRWVGLLAAVLLAACAVGLGVVIVGGGSIGERQELNAQSSIPLLAFEVDDARSMARFEDAKAAFYKGEFPRAATLVNPLVEAHPDQPAPAMLAFVLYNFNGVVMGDVVRLLDRARDVPNQEHPAAILAHLTFDALHSTSGGPGAILQDDQWLASQGDGYDTLLVSAIIGIGGIDDESLKLHPERVHAALLPSGADRPLTHIVIAEYWLNQVPAEGAREAFDAAVEAGLQVADDPSYLVYLRGRLQQESGEYEAARDTFIDVLKRNPSMGIARERLISIHLVLGDDERRAAEVGTVLGETTSDEQKKTFCFQHGKELLTYGMLNDAIAMMRCQVDISIAQQAYGSALETQNRIVGAAQGFRAWSAYEKAVDRFAMLLAEPEIAEETRQGFMVMNLLSKANYLADTGDVDAAEALLKRLEAMPESKYQFIHKGSQLEWLGSHIRIARKDYKTQAELYPNPPTGCQYLWAYPVVSEVILNVQGVEAAIAHLEQPLPTECDAADERFHRRYVPPILAALAALQMSEGRLDDARESLRRFDALWPSPDADLPTVVQIEDIRRRLETE